MTEKQISELFLDYRSTKAECVIVQICSADLSDADKERFMEKQTKLHKKIAIANQLLYILPNDEKFVIEKHCIEGLSWSELSDIIYQDANSKLPYNKRSLQRIKARAINRMHEFIESNFGDALDVYCL